MGWRDGEVALWWYHALGDTDDRLHRACVRACVDRLRLLRRRWPDLVWLACSDDAVFFTAPFGLPAFKPLCAFFELFPAIANESLTLTVAGARWFNRYHGEAIATTTTRTMIPALVVASKPRLYLSLMVVT